MRRAFAFVFSLWVLASAGAALADEVFLSNGDRITGKILSAADDKLVIQPDFDQSAKLTIPFGRIATFNSSNSLAVELRNGTVIPQAMASAAGSQIVLAQPDAEGGGREIAVQDIQRINPEAVAWHGSVGVNGLYGRSTTTAAQIGVSADGERRGEESRITLSGNYSYGVQKVAGVTDTNVNNWLVQGKYDRFFSPDWYAYFAVKAQGDEVNFLSLRAAPSVGAGRQWIDKGNFHFSTEGGATYLYEDYKNQLSNTRDLALRLAYHADRDFGAGRIKLTHNLEYLQSGTNTDKFLVTTDAGVRFALTSRMFSELKGRLTYDNKPGIGSRHTTTELRIGVGYTY